MQIKTTVRHTWHLDAIQLNAYEKKVQNVTVVYGKPKANLRNIKKKKTFYYSSILPPNYDSKEFWILKTNAYFLNRVYKPLNLMSQDTHINTKIDRKQWWI